MPPVTLTMAVVLLAVFSDRDVVGGVQIMDLRVPAAVRNGSDSAILDCEYSLRQDELNTRSGLVVKWFFNNGPAPVYQWIPRQKPQDLGILRGKLDLSHKASQDEATMYRALYIRNPTTELTGQYKCFVSTFQDEDFMIKNMVVYAPEKKLEVTQTKLDLDTVNVTCKAQGVFPEPKLSIFKSDDKKTTVPIAGVQVISEQAGGGEAFDVTGSVVMPAVTDDTHIGCQITIPHTQYTSTRFLNYFPASGGTSLRWLGGICLYVLCILLVSLAAPPSC